jgi:hypothetical protein
MHTFWRACMREPRMRSANHDGVMRKATETSSRGRQVKYTYELASQP